MEQKLNIAEILKNKPRGTKLYSMIHGKCIGIYQFNADNTNFLKYYKICSQSEWESAIDRLNIWFKDASLKIKKL